MNIKAVLGLFACLILAGCQAKDNSIISADDYEVSSSVSQTEEEMSSQVILKGESIVAGEKTEEIKNPLFPNAIPLKNKYVEKIADELLAEIITRDMSDINRIKTVYDYLIANTYFENPVGLDVWRYRGEDETIPTYVENRAISPILFGIGTCEDYAAAMAVLANRMGYEAKYVFGMTISVKGDYVDHAWTVIKLGDLWYHLDPQLEDNIARGDKVKNRYFMRRDEVMYQDHKWGENLAEYCRMLSEEKKQYIINQLSIPKCDGEIPPAGAYDLEQAPKPDRQAIINGLDAEKEEYEAKNGKLEPITLNITPPMEINP